MRLPPYPKYKPSGIDGLGDVPEHWAKTALKYTADFQNGYPFSPEERGDSGLPIVRIAQLTGDQEPAYFDGNLPSRVKIDTGTLLFSWSATIDTFIWSGGPAWVNQHIFKTTPVPGVGTKFLFYLIKHVAPKLADVDAHGSTMRHIKKESLGERLFIPALPEQRAIADFLDRETAKIDTLVAKKRTLIERLKEKRIALISRTVTRGLPPDAARAAGLEPQPRLKPSGIDWLGDVPEHWKPERLRRACARVTDGAHISPDLSSPDYPFVSTVDIANGQIDLMGCLWTSTECFEYLAHTGCQPRRNDVLFSKDGTIGRTAVVQSDTHFVVASSLVILSPKPTRLIARFLDYWLNNSLLQQDMLLQLAGAALRRISVEKVGRLPVVLPPIGEQTAIADFLDRETAQVDVMVARVETAIDRLQEYRTALIAAAVTGKVDVREAHG